MEAAGGGSGAAGNGVSLLGVSDVQRIGGVLLSVLGHSKHNGVLENAHAGLLQVCERLLSSDDVSYRLVCGWLEELMSRIRVADDDSWLRRSRGIAFALLAILKAQPTHRPAVLLSQAMDAVLKEAVKAASTSVDGLSEWRSAVHGLNLLRSLFRDSSVHVGCLPYVTAALEASVGGFSHPVWAVRNSALISFAPIALKAMRAQYNQQMAQQSGMTATELFSLYPELRPLLLCHLQLATATPTAASHMHPTLYPLLLILSRLRAAHSAASEPRTADMRPFVDALHCLAAHPHQQARRMAARALVALTFTEQQQTVICEVAQQLPVSALEQRRTPTDWNTVDGRLLQLTALFDVRQSQRDRSSESRWLESLVDELLAREWLGSPAVPIPAIRVAYLQLLVSALLSLSDRHHYRSLSQLRGCLTSLAVCCEQPVSFSFVGVGGAGMRSRAASLLVRLLLAAREAVDVTPMCLSLLSDLDVGVRHAVMQTVQFAVLPLRHGLTARLSLAAVHSSLCASLADLSHPPTLSVALRLLTHLDEHLLTVAEGTRDVSLAEPHLWPLLLAAASSDNVEVQAAALPCLGRSVRAAVSGYLQAHSPSVAALRDVLSRCTAWLCCLSECSDDLRVPAVRHAAWLSVNQSGCLQLTALPAARRQHIQLDLDPPIVVSGLRPSALWPGPPWCVRSLIDVSLWLWQLVVRAMCDESAAIRDDAAALAYVALTHSDTLSPAVSSRPHLQPLPSPLPSTLSASSRTRLPAVSVPSAVLERSFAHIASTFSSEQAITFTLASFTAHSSDGQRPTRHKARLHSVLPSTATACSHRMSPLLEPLSVGP